MKYPSRDGRRDAYLLKSSDGEKPPAKGLVRIDKSPNYCDEEKQKRIPGTTERLCNRTSTEADGCKFLCCGRGYNTHEIVKRWDCNCKFHWCCYVKCRKCKDRIEEFRCKWNCCPMITVQTCVHRVEDYSYIWVILVCAAGYGMIFEDIIFAPFGIVCPVWSLGRIPKFPFINAQLNEK